MELTQSINKFLKEKCADIFALRGYLHEHPEISTQEFNTAAFVRKKLLNLNLNLIPTKSNNIIALLDTGRSGPSIVLRSDLDALPIKENPNNMKQKKRYISKNPSASHMCGHDAHITILLSAADFLVTHKEQLCGIIYFVFEQAEENGKGYREIIEILSKYKIDACWMIHVVPMIESGKISIEKGARFAGVLPINISVKGVGGHGSRPDLCINPLFCASAIITSVSQQWATQFGPEEYCTLGLTQISGGIAANVIAETMNIEGTLRFLDRKSAEKGFDIIERTSYAMGQAYKCQIKVSEPLYGKPVINNIDLVNTYIDFSKNYFKNELVSMPTWFASESFNHLSNKYPSIAAFLGTRNEEKGIYAQNHDARFDIDDENVLPLGIKATIFFAYSLLWRGGGEGDV